MKIRDLRRRIKIIHHTHLLSCFRIYKFSKKVCIQSVYEDGYDDNNSWDCYRVWRWK